MANGEHIEVAKAYVTIVPSLEGSQKTISEELGVATSEAAKSAGEQSGADFSNALATGIKASAAVVAAAVAAVTAAAVATGKAFIEAANDVSEWGDTVDKESQKMNMSAQGYQEWAFILEHAGASIEGMKTSMKKLTVAAEEGNDAFAALGISEEQLAAMSPEETWNATIEALQNVTDEGERTALANQLLGKGAVELAPLFNMTAEETEALKTQVNELGGVMSDDAVKAAAEYQDELQNMKVALTGVKNNMMSQFLPGMSQVMKGLSLVFSGNGGIEEIKEGLNEVIGKITELAPQFLEIAQVIVLAVLEGFGPMLPVMAEAIFSFLGEALMTVTTLIPQLLPVITTGIQGILSAVFQCLPLILTSLMTLITDLVTWLASGDNVKTFSNGVVQLVTLLVKQFGMILPILLPAVVSIIADVATTITTPENIGMILEAVLLVVGAVIMALANSVPEFIGYITGLLTNIKDNIIAFLNWISPGITQAISSALSTIQSWGASIKNYITNLVSGIWNGITSFLSKLQTGFSTAFSNVLSWVGTIISGIQGFVGNIISTLMSLPSAVVSIGENLVKGLWNGIEDKVDWVCEKIKGMGKSIEKAIKKVFGIASPSKVFAEIGDYLAQGLGVGFEDGMGGVEDDMIGQMEGLTGSMNAEVSAYGAGGAATVGDSTTINNNRPITMNIYGAEGQDIGALADIIAEKLGDTTVRKEKVYA